MKASFLPIGLITLLALSACAAKKPATVQGVSYVVPKECLTADVILDKCPPEDPEHCKSAIVRYRRGCEVVKVGK